MVRAGWEWELEEEEMVHKEKLSFLSLLYGDSMEVSLDERIFLPMIIWNAKKNPV